MVKLCNRFPLAPFSRTVLFEVWYIVTPKGRDRVAVVVPAVVALQQTEYGASAPHHLSGVAFRMKNAFFFNSTLELCVYIVLLYLLMRWR